MISNYNKLGLPNAQLILSVHMICFITEWCDWRIRGSERSLFSLRKHKRKLSCPFSSPINWCNRLTLEVTNLLFAPHECWLFSKWLFWLEFSRSRTIFKRKLIYLIYKSRNIKVLLEKKWRGFQVVIWFI